MRVRTVYALVAHHRTGSMTLNAALDNDSEVRAHPEILREDPDDCKSRTPQAPPYREPEPGDMVLDCLFDLADGWSRPTCSGLKVSYTRPGHARRTISFRQQPQQVRSRAGNNRVLARRCAGSRWAAFLEDGSGHCDYRK